jgi:hypothetical protein
MKVFLASLLLCLLSVPLGAQKRPVPPAERGYRIIGIDQVIQDPKTGARMPAHAGRLSFVVLGYHKDGLHCLVEITAPNFADHAGFRALAESGADPMVMVFDKALVKPEVYRPILKAAGFPNVDFEKSKVVAP